MVNSKFPVFLFIGNDSYLKEKAIEDLTSSLLDHSSRQLDYKIFYGGETEAREILDYVTTFPFLAARRLAFVKDLEKLPPEFKAPLVAYVKKPLKSTCLILESKDSSILDEYGELSKYVNINRFDGLKDSEALSWVKKFLASRDKKIENDAALLLREMRGQDLLSLTQELEKLIAFIGERDCIKVSDVEEVVGRSLIASAFDLTDAIGKKDIEDALRIVSDLISAGKKHYEIIGLLSWHVKRLLRAKMLQAKGQTDSHIVNLLKLSRRYSDQFFKQLRLIQIPQMRSKMAVLFEADLDIKRTKFDPTLVLEFAIIKLCLS